MIATSLIPLDTILPEKYAFILGINCTLWTEMRSLAGSLADGVQNLVGNSCLRKSAAVP